MFTPRPRLIAALFALTLLPAHAAQRRDREETALAPPQPMPLKVKAMRGQDTDITLRIYGRRNQALNFIVRQPPATGRLSEPRGVEPEVGRVRYRPTDDVRVIRDSFQYAVKSPDGVSAPSSVEIEIIDVPSTLNIPVELPFSQLLAGTSEMKSLEIENTGGTVAEGEILVPEPWKLEGSPRYRVEPENRAIFRLRFAPSQGGAFSGEVRFSSHTDRVTYRYTPARYREFSHTPAASKAKRSPSNSPE